VLDVYWYSSFVSHNIADFPVHYDHVSCVMHPITSDICMLQAFVPGLPNPDLSLHIIKCATVVIPNFRVVFPLMVPPLLSMAVKHRSQCCVVSSKRLCNTASFFGNWQAARIEPPEYCIPPSEQRVSKDRGHKRVTRLPGEAESMKVLPRCRDRAQYLRRLFADKKGKHKAPKQICDDLELWPLDAG
jgi:hypothetical protein